MQISTIHHTAFDSNSNIVGLNPEYIIIVREDNLEEIEGPMRRYGTQEMHGQKILLPGSRNNWPDRERLELRYQRFKEAG